MTELLRPLVGIGVVVRKGNLILLGKRKGSHGAGEWAGPGGHLEHGESISDCAKREVREETGLIIGHIGLLCFTNMLQYLPKHYADIGVVADWVDGEPQVLEPDKVESWGWFDIYSQLPNPLFAAVGNYIEALQTGRLLFDS